MKNYISYLLITIILFSASSPVLAGCDMCSLYLGMHPNQTKNSIGLRYRWSEYSGVNGHAHHVSHSNSNSNTQRRVFQTAELWGQWMPSHRVQILFIVPYSMNSVENESNRQVIDVYNNLGDAQAIVRYLIYRSSDENKFQQQFNAGIGIKTPTGQYKEYSRENYLDPHMQNGTGSWDVLLTSSYLLKAERVGFNQEINYKINTENNLKFKFANRFSSASTLFYSFKKTSFSFIPQFTFLIEHAGYDNDQGLSMYVTNGTAVYGQMGCDLYIRKLGINCGIAKPMIEELRDKDATNSLRFNIGLNYLL